MGLLNKDEYFFYEWLICLRKMDSDEFSRLTPEEIVLLRQ